ncbi:hypothetical protein BKA69DRAFT_1046109 [Paraphysoderma sedebokerense]|nr:hypothetical protein BKA69DRAFT_1046109 [Paraphysoderma sedebokerense]
MSVNKKKLEDPKFFSDDVVGLASDPTLVGLVTRTSHEEDDDSDSEDEKDEAPIAPFHVEVHWLTNLTLDPTIYHQNDLLLLDRSLLPGHVVLNPDDRRMCGIVTDAIILANLQKVNDHKEIVEKVDTKNLKEPYFDDGELVVMGNWIGSVDEFRLRIEIRFENGTTCRWREDCLYIDILEQDDFSKRNMFVPNRFYPGMKIKVHSRFPTFKDIEWLTESREVGDGVGHITQVFPAAADVHWTVFNPAASPGDDGQVDATRPCIHVDLLKDKDRLKPLKSKFEHATIRLGDMVMYCTETDRNIFATPDDGILVILYRVVNTSTVVSVLWQDGTITSGLASNRLYAPVVVDDSMMLPTEYVIHKSTDVAENADRDEKVGVIQKIDHVERTALVRWFNDGEDLDGLQETPTLHSLYELDEHPSYNPPILDRILLPSLPLASSVMDTNSVSNLNWIGEIVGTTLDGFCVIQFASGDEALIRPNEFMVVDENDLKEGEGEGDDAWSTDEEDEIFDDEEDEEEEEEGEKKSDGQKKQAKDRSKPLGREIHDEEDSSWETVSDDSEGEIDGKSKPKSSKLETPAKTSREIAKVLEAERITPPSSPYKPGKLELKEHESVFNWRGFDILDEAPPDLIAEDEFTSPPKNFLKRLQQEYKLLNNLPDGIKVQTYSTHLHLFRALVAGPYDTPYENGLFMFDISLGSDYPQSPPDVKFRSWSGGKLNPNLYEDGNVCLSLLNTWHGKQSESWSADSSILQFLISAQALILVKEPYYNEAGYNKFVGTMEGYDHSKMYNEKAYILSLKSILYILNHPPSTFITDIHEFYFSSDEKLSQVVRRAERIVNDSEIHSSRDEQVQDQGTVGDTNGDIMKVVSKGCVQMLKVLINQLKTKQKYKEIALWKADINR